MLRGVPLKENIEFLLFQYKKDLEYLEEHKNVENYTILHETYSIIIVELEFALNVSK